MDLAAEWHALLEAEEQTPAACLGFAAALRAQKLTFGDRVHCPFLRPFLLTGSDEQRIRAAAETIAAAGERVVQAAMASPPLLHELGMTDPEIALAAIDPGYGTASTSSRLDAFLLPDSLHFAEYNAESPAGLGYTQRLGDLFDVLPVMQRFRERHAVRYYRPMDGMLAALLASYADWGGVASPPTIASWTGARCRPGRSSRSSPRPSPGPGFPPSSAIHATWFSTAARSRLAGAGSISCTAGFSSTTS